MREVVVDRKTGLPRQAGATLPEGEFIQRLRAKCEQDLYTFSVAVMGRNYLTPHLHLPICNFLQKVPPARKMLLLPRDHAKTSIVGHCLPPHILIQPAKTNIYFPTLEGSECRILLSGESATRAETNLRVVATAFTGNKLMRAFWPHRCYESLKHAKSTARKWNEQQLIIPRSGDWPDPSVYAIGVGGAITGSRPNVMIKDDLVSLAAANSEVEMRTAIEWHKASRALMDEYEKDTGLESLEFIIGTRWAVFDLYEYILSGDGEIGPDHSVEYLRRRIVEPDMHDNPQPIWPERFPLDRVDQLRREFGSMFHLLYMNEPSDPNLVDFDMTMVRNFTYTGETITFKEDERDERLEKLQGRMTVTPSVPKFPRTMPANAETFATLTEGGRENWMRIKYQ